ncbi:MAG: class II fructose-bisphosphate aldolase [Firmicutes bacterium]|nr:class II fructose-bisphosphate aldolase [Bacillota bacterium]
MSIVDLETVLAIAEEKGCAIPSFNVYNMETVMGVARAAEETNSVVIFQVYSRLFDNAEATYLAPIILQAINRMKGKAAFHLDHGVKDKEILRALRLGVTGVMYDGSTLPLAENIAETKRIVSLCQEVGIGVEGELGHVGTTKEGSGIRHHRIEDGTRGNL